MATLNWQPVQNPNFSGSLEGLRLFGNMVGNATNGLSDALGGFQKSREAEAQQRALTAAQQYTDPAAYQAALASGQVTSGIDPSLLTPAALEGLQSRSGTLLNQATVAQKLSTDRYTADRTKTENLASDAARPGVAAMLQTALGSPLAPEVAGLPTKDLLALARDTQSLEGGALINKDRRTAQDLAAEQRQAQASADTALQSDLPALLSPDAARSYLINSSLPIDAKKIVQAKLESQFGQLFGPVIGTGTTPTTPGAAPRTAAGVPSGSASASTMIGSAAGPALDSSKIFDIGVLGQESGYRQFKPDGTPLTSPKGATGIAQVMPATGPEAARLAGLPWDENKFKTDKDYNAAIGKAYFNKQVTDFGDPQKALAAYNAGPGAMRAAERKAADAGTPNDWLKFLPEETQKYVPGVMGRLGNDAATALTAAAQPDVSKRSLGAATDALGLSAIENRSGNFYMDRLQKATTDNSTTAQITNQLVAGDYKGINPVMLENAIDDTARQAGVTPAIASEMVMRSLTRQNGYMPFAMGGSGTHTINSDRLKQEIKNWSAPGGVRDVLVRGRDIALTGEELTKASASYDSAKADLAAAKKRAESVPSVASQLPALEAQVEKKKAAVLLANKAIQEKNMQGSVAKPPGSTKDANQGPQVLTALSPIDQKIVEANQRASKLPLASSERAAVLNEIRQLQMERASSSPTFSGIF